MPWDILVTVAVIHLLAVASPGPDMIMVSRQSLTHGRATGMWTAVGVAAGNLVHIGLALIGLGVLIHQSALLFTILKFAGGAYLVFLGIQALRARPGRRDDKDLPGGDLREVPRPAAAVRVGALCCLLNPKAALYFLSLFTVVIVPGTPWMVQAVLATCMVASTASLYAALAAGLSLPAIRRVVAGIGHWIERAMGAALVTLGVKLALARAA